MAYVPISESLTNRIIANLAHLEEIELRALGDEAKLVGNIKNDEEAIEKIDALIWGEEIDLRERLRKYDKQVPITFSVEFADLPYADGPQRNDLRIVVNGPCFCQYNTYYPMVQTNERFENSGLNQLESVKAWMEFTKARLECKHRWAKVKRTVITFLRNSKSLNQALKVWPDLERYCPEDVIKKVNEKIERSKPSSNAVTALSKEDVELIQASTVLARMAGADV